MGEKSSPGRSGLCPSPASGRFIATALKHLIAFLRRKPAARDPREGGKVLRMREGVQLKAPPKTMVLSRLLKHTRFTGMHEGFPPGFPELRITGLWDPVQTPGHSTKGPSESAAPTPTGQLTPPPPSRRGAGAAPLAGRPPDSPPGDSELTPQTPFKHRPPARHPHTVGPPHRGCVTDKQTRTPARPAGEEAATVSKVPARQLARPTDMKEYADDLGGGQRQGHSTEVWEGAGHVS